ncbi:unnamed protein product [Absidia cylindrospora]
MNKALLSKWLTYPIPTDKVSTLATLSMDWIGSTGYMFSVLQHQDVFVAQHFANLEYTLYVANMANFLDTLDALYIWKNHHLDRMDLMLPAVNRKKHQDLISSDVPSHDSPFVSPNVLFTPSQRRRTRIW